MSFCPAAEVAAAEIIGEDEDEVEFRGRLSSNKAAAGSFRFRLLELRLEIIDDPAAGAILAVPFLRLDYEVNHAHDVLLVSKRNRREAFFEESQHGGEQGLPVRPAHSVPQQRGRKRKRVAQSQRPSVPPAPA